MVNRLYLLIVFFLFVMPSSLYAQINVSLDRDCMKYNSSILSQSFIESVGEDTVTMLLDNDIRILIFIDVDSLGCVLKFRKMSSNKKISEDLINKVIKNLVETNKHFFICFEKLQGMKNCEAITKDLFDTNKKSIFINVAFPGELMSSYNYEMQIEKKQGLNLSKYEYLQRRIKKYL